jgi:hypothetical protein
MADTGVKPFSNALNSFGSGGKAWVDASLALANDGYEAFAISPDSGGNTGDGAQQSQQLHTYNWSNSIPSTATINGIECHLKARAPYDYWATQPCYAEVYLADGGGNAPYFKTAALTSFSNNYILGGATDLWSRSWTPATISAAYFYTIVKSYDGFGIEAYIDFVGIKVYYTEAAAPSTGGFWLVH